MGPSIRPREASSAIVSELQLAADPCELAVARRYAEEAGAAFGLDGNDCFDFAFAVNEAVTNAIRHGAPDEHGNIHLSVAVEDESLVFTVRDSGSFAVPDRGRDECVESGRGLALMATLMDEVTLSIGNLGTVLSLAKLHPAAAVAAATSTGAGNPSASMGRRAPLRLVHPG